jgi:SAM-dependent methyltransferase
MQSANLNKSLGQIFLAASIILFISPIFVSCQNQVNERRLTSTSTTRPKAQTPKPERRPLHSLPMPAKFDPKNSIKPIPPSGTHLDGTTVDELKELIRKRVKKPKDLWFSFATNVFINEHLKSLKFDENTVIGDIGCGPGAYGVLLILNKTPFKKFYAVDVDKKSLGIFQFLLDEYFPEHKSKFELVLSKYDDVMLPEKSLDVVVMSDAHFFMDSDVGQFSAETERCMASIHRAMKQDGKAYVYEAKGFDVSPEILPKLTQMTSPFTRNGFTLEWTSTDGPLFSFIFNP